jgi:ketosteroid isomerase-like protein
MAAELGKVIGAEDLVARINDESLLAEGVEVLSAAVTPDFEFVMVATESSGAQPVEFRGVEGYLEGLSEWVAPFDSYRIEIGRLIEAGDVVVGLARQIATPRGSQAAIETQAAALMIFGDGRLRRLEFHLDPNVAIRAAGLDPQSFQE